MAVGVYDRANVNARFKNGNPCGAPNCERRLRADNLAGFCVEHRRKGLAGNLDKSSGVCDFPECGKVLRSDNKIGRCDPHRHVRRLIAAECANETCTRRIRSDNTTGFCVEHAPRGKYNYYVPRPKAGPCGVSECQRELRIDNKTGFCGYHAQFTPEARAQRREISATRRARQVDAFVEYVDPTVLWERDGGTCHICRLPVDPSDWHIEHIVPLDRGGEHSYANTAVAHPKCNWSKGTKLIEEMI